MPETEDYLTYAIAVANHLAKAEDIPNWEGAFVSSSRASYFFPYPSRKIMFSPRDITYCTEKGYYEHYRLLIPVWDDLLGPGKVDVWGGSIRGYEAVWCIVIHEFAHVLQSIWGRERGKAHKAKFQKALRILVARYPYSAFTDLEGAS